MKKLAIFVLFFVLLSICWGIENDSNLVSPEVIGKADPYNQTYAGFYNAPEKHSNPSKSNHLRYITENPHAPNQPPGLDNKPYTLLQTAGYHGARFFHPLSNKQNQTVELIYGNTDESLRQKFHLTTPIAAIAVPRQSIPFRANSQPSKSKRFYLTSRFSFFSADRS